MENSTAHHDHAHGEASPPFLGFPLGTALLMITIFSLSAIISCCYHWEKIRYFRPSFSNSLEADDQSLPKPKITPISSMEQQKESLPVLMPGDNYPKFIALPCPCRPPIYR